MRKLFFFCLIVFTTIYTVAASSALPDWILPELKKYPIEKYLFHVGESQGTGEQAFEESVAVAHRKIATEILRNVETVIRYNKSELQHDLVQEYYSVVLEDYCSSRQVLPAMRLRGFSVRNLSVDTSRTAPQTYALVYIEREKLRQHYAEHVSELSKDINSLLESAKFSENAYEVETAVKKYLQTYPLYEALKEAEIIQIGAEYKYAINHTKAFKRLAKSAMGTSSALQMSYKEVMKRVTELRPQMVGTVDELVSAIKFQLLQQLGTAPRKCWIEQVAYEGTEVTSPVTQKLNTALLKHLGWQAFEPIHNFQQSSPDINPINQVDLLERVTSSCWENGDERTFRAAVRNMRNGDFVAIAVVQFLNSQLRSPIVFEPVGYKQMRTEIDTFEPQDYRLSPRGEEISTPLEELAVEVWTRQGRGPLHYIEGETDESLARVNQPAYIRLLYTLADGKRTLLHDNYHVDASKVDSDVEIGEFVCTPPFGAEMLFIVARTEPFATIKTRKENGHIFLIDQDSESAARRTRGMQRIEDEVHTLI